MIGVTRHRVLLGAALLLVTLAAYQPAWQGGMLWDDDAHLTATALQSRDGLRRIWFEIGATQQYYPVTHSAFWVQHTLWGDRTLGYHLVNIGLHATCAWLFGLILVRLNVPGAWLAAFIFAVHPVHVESVAWMTELKNTLSGAVGLGAMLVLIGSGDLADERSRDRRIATPRDRQNARSISRSPNRQIGRYALALSLFALALLSKTTVAVLPAALLVVVWWQRGTIEWRRDVRPIVPLLALGVAGGILTSWVERTQIIGAAQSFSALGLVERVLVAGRAMWFYLAKLAWPTDLAFIYPRWTIDARIWWQWLYPAGVVAAALVCWKIARSPTGGSGRAARAPMAVLLLFVGLLFPALGIIDIYPFRFSFVADHFQYLASMAAIAAFASFVQSRDRWRNRPIARSLEVLLIFLLTVLTWRQARLYADAETIYRETLRRNPACWLCANNLGVLRPPDRADEALALFGQAIRLNPQYAEAHNNIGAIREQRGDPRAAIEEYRLALASEPDYPAAKRNLGMALAAYARAAADGGAAAEAGQHLREALRHYPADSALHYSLGLTLVSQDPVQALERFQQATRLNPGLAEAHNSAGNLLLGSGRVDEAIVKYREALRLKPDFADAHYNLGNAYLRRGQADEAMAAYREAVRLSPALPEPHNSIGNLLRRAGRLHDAVAEYRTALRLNPTFGDAAFNLGNALYQSRQPADAVQAFRQALAAHPEDADAHNNLALALEALGRVDEAAAEYREALRLNPQMTEARANLERIGRR
jgi:tetratricopeptide (TPR) repeat protein